jgi:RHS repeat-associated protein
VAAHLANPLADPEAILQRATTRIVYDLFAYVRTSQDPQPQAAVAYALARETHDSDLSAGERSRIQHAFAYSDGFGREIQKKAQAEPGSLTRGGPAVSPRWVGSGWTIFNNKEKPVRQYEPFFSATHQFEFARAEGVSPVLCYDPLGRVVATLHPDHTWEMVTFDSWQQQSWDANDTILIANPEDKPDVADYFRRLPAADYLPGWHAQRAAGAMGAAEQEAAIKAAVHADTPVVTHFDSLSRSFLTVAHNRFKRTDSLPADPPEEAFLRTRIVFDIEGNERDVVDALDRIVVHHDFDMLGNKIHTISMDGGERWMLSDVAGRPRYGWDSRDHRVRTTYDVLGRQSEVFVQTGGPAELLVARTVYGESQLNAEAANLRGKVFQVFDGAGVAVTPDYDFKGNPVSRSRQLAVDYKTTLDWSTTVALEEEVLTTRTTFDAMNRVLTTSTPDGSIIRRSYNEAGLLETVETNRRGETANGQPAWTPIVTAVAYNARAQRERIVYGNGVATIHEYDPLTFRLKRLQTRAGSSRLQDLSYAHDPVGNITRIEDAAQQAIYFRNRRVDASNDYVYDATYQLIEATGREHLGQRNGQPNAPAPPDAVDTVHTGGDHPADGNAMGRYLERYRYDAVGNFIETQHVGSDPAHPGWTRVHTYAEPSATEHTKVNNRLSVTRVGNRSIEPYAYDAHGNTISTPHLPALRWNYRDRLEATVRQVVNGGTSETTYYVYGDSGERVRKVTERAAAAGAAAVRTDERIYLDGFEIYRAYGGGSTVNLERQTLHVMDDTRRVALCETRSLGDDGSPPQLIRYQIGNHLASASLELNDAGAVISYEEFYPYGSTSHEANDGRIAAAAKRYRFTAKERDEETGLAFHGARYYMPWLGRWSIPDPAGVSAGINVFRYVHNRPTQFVDPTGHADQPAGRKTPHKIPVKPGFVNPGVSGELDFAADPAVRMLTPQEFEEERQANVQVFHVIRDLGPAGSGGRGGPGGHSFALVVIKDPKLFNPLQDPRFAGRLNFQDTVDDPAQYAFEQAPELLETGEGRYFFTIGAYKANRVPDPDSDRFLDVKINEETDRIDAVEFIFNRADARSANPNGAVGYRIETPPNMSAEQLVNEMLELSATYRSTGVDIPYPSTPATICRTVLGPVFGSSDITNSNSFVRSLFIHAGATNVQSNMAGADTGMDVLIPKSTFQTGVVNQPVPWCPF